jgi:hypothetical protein
MEGEISRSSLTKTEAQFIRICSNERMPDNDTAFSGEQMGHWENEPAETIMARLFKKVQEAPYQDIATQFLHRVRSDPLPPANAPDYSGQLCTFVQNFVDNHEQEFNAFEEMLSQIFEEEGEFAIGRNPAWGTSS